jgi:hypothetical protein
MVGNPVDASSPRCRCLRGRQSNSICPPVREAPSNGRQTNEDALLNTGGAQRAGSSQSVGTSAAEVIFIGPDLVGLMTRRSRVRIPPPLSGRQGVRACRMPCTPADRDLEGHRKVAFVVRREGHHERPGQTRVNHGCPDACRSDGARPGCADKADELAEGCGELDQLVSRGHRLTVNRRGAGEGRGHRV